jgi:type IV pilus assembly protein PilA
VAIPAYQDYIAKAQFTTALSDITGGKVGAENKLMEGVLPTAPAEIGLQTTTSRCSGVAVAFAAGGGGTIVCTMTGGPLVNGKTITLTRIADTAATSAGAWACTTNVVETAAKIMAKGCTRV